ncbi:P-loop containing nucleoside triphosphate hydrolase protein [Dendrothele bispora CBS 962.96]|uniref:P-loop containing nucleoside triphosphate hydrolase protein n=1 Tax=Dendrothele bispora (strain CBS 962.96) TaxID=1314807 RepID=A0A4S8MKJ8_DENBC|nr:P-loop containing nucleoside triphosphate hydrolase protein [Dendrothele bispora CBS 962.96]
MDSLKNIFFPLAGSMGALHETFKLLVIGAMIESARRISVLTWNGFVDIFFHSAYFYQEDVAYDWLMHFLSKQPTWGRSREFEVTTRDISRHNLTTSGDLGDEEDEDGQLVAAFMPSIDSTHNFYFHGRWFRVTRSTRSSDYRRGGSLKITGFALDNEIFKKLVLQARRDYTMDVKERVHIFLTDDMSYGNWKYVGARPKRPMTSMVLEPDLKDALLADCKEFLSSEEWCVDSLFLGSHFNSAITSDTASGIPFRRGYLLHGVPGSGKTSLVHSLAGELGLNIYVVSLTSKGMNDNTLTTLMGRAPPRSIFLLEDLDAVFTRSVSRDPSSTGTPKESTTSEGSSSQDNNDDSKLSLSGLLNSIDGVAAAEGRLFFATTNYKERLDPALIRDGRIDRSFEFTHARKWHAECIFKCFFLPCKTSSSASSSLSTNDKDASERSFPGSKHKLGHSASLVSGDEIAVLAKRFAEAIPENELSVANLQGYLLKNKTRPKECVDEVEQWICEQRKNTKRPKEGLRPE